MSKGVVNQRVAEMRGGIKRYSKMLHSYIDRVALVRACQFPRRSERLYAYDSILQEACCQCFRGMPGVHGVKPVVYAFDGKVWVPLQEGIFEDVLGTAIVAASGVGEHVLKADWVERRYQMMQYAYKGVMCSPLELSADIVGFQNGVWDFSDIDSPVYHPFSDMLPVVSLLPYDYDASAGCPLWLSFLCQMLSAVDILRLQKYLGMGVVRRSAMGQRIEDTLWLVGGGANGKTTIEEVVRAVYGVDRIGNATMSQLLDRNPDARMRAVLSIEGKAFNLCDEVDLDDITKMSDAFKKLCSGEPQNVRAIGGNIRVAYEIPFLLFSMNQRPRNKRMDEAFRRRIVEIDFRRVVREEDMDRGLLDKLLCELSGIRNWMMEGYRKLRADGYRFNHTMDEGYMEQNEQYFDIFIRKVGIRASGWVGRGEEPQLVRSSSLYDDFTDFCAKNLYDLPSHRGMTQDLKRLGFRSVRKASGVFYEVYADKALPYSAH